MASGLKLKKKLSEYKSISVESVSWKQKHGSFKKPISFEKWKFDDKTCILEASAKFEDPLQTEPSLKTASEEAMKKLRLVVDGLGLGGKKPIPSTEQGNKTGKALKSSILK